MVRLCQTIGGSLSCHFLLGVIKQIDEVLLPEVSRAEGKLHFTVVRGHAIGDLVPHVRNEPG